MSEFDLGRVRGFVSENIATFHRARLQRVQSLNLSDVLRRKNPYLFKAKNVNNAHDLVTSILEAYLSSSEEGLFGHFLEELAIFINYIAYSGQKSATTGIDLEFNRDDIRYLVAIKSGPNWGNSDQHKKLRESFKTALRVVRQSAHAGDVRAVEGICYGRSHTQDNGDHFLICGQAFWEFISGASNLYIDIVEPLGHEAKQHNDAFVLERDRAYNRFVRDFTHDFCETSGQIDWEKLVRFNSGPGRKRGA